MASKESLGRVRHFDLISQQVRVYFFAYLLPSSSFLQERDRSIYGWSSIYFNKVPPSFQISRIFGEGGNSFLPGQVIFATLFVLRIRLTGNLTQYIVQNEFRPNNLQCT